MIYAANKDGLLLIDRLHESIEPLKQAGRNAEVGLVLAVIKVTEWYLSAHVLSIEEMRNLTDLINVTLDGLNDGS